MKFQTPPRLTLALLGAVLTMSVLACGPQPGPDNQVTRHGEDVLASGSAPRVMDSVPGDAILAGGDLLFTGASGGDYLGAGGKQAIGGRIHESVRAAGGEIHVTAAVDRNATLAGGTVAVDRPAVIGRNAYLAGGTVRVEGTVREAIQACGGTVILDGVVGGDVEVTAGTLRIGPHAEIAGGLRYRVPRQNVHIDPAARISGTITALPVPQGRGVWYLLGILWMLGFIVVGVVMVALVPRLMAEAVEILRARPGRSALVGLGWIILVPIAALMVAVTIIGLPLALLAGVAYFVLMYLGRVALAVWLGQRVLGARAAMGRSGMIAKFLVGGFIIFFVRFVPVIGPLAILVATILGLGALLLRVYALREQ